MFKYPLAVTIDTNIFDAAKFDLCDASPLKTLENYVKNGKIKVVLSDIVVRESKRHIADQIKKICGIMRKARAAALEESTEHLISTIGLGEISLSIGDNQISPDEGSEEVIDICFSNGDENTTSGYIKLTVGYLNFDEDGGAADGISDKVEYEYHDILKELDNFIYAQNCLIEKDTRIAEIISEAIKTNGDNT